jgi:2-polyprenyl-3-methyl-5-hydroxy-6-metoxy-1,4-benzoquinol methylase
MKKCRLCKNMQLLTVSKKVRDSKKHKILQCKKCEFIQLYPLPNQIELSEFYDKNRQVKNAGINYNIATIERKAYEDTKRRVETIQRLVKKKQRIIEIGSGHGFFLKKMADLGWDITGIEISKQRREDSEKRTKVKILNVNLNDNTENLGKFDIVLLFHVLEHISEPVEFLANIKKMLSKNGKLIIEVPNVKDHHLHSSKEYTEWYWQKAHLNYFSSNTLKHTLQKAKFKKISINGIQRYSIENFFYWKINKKPQLLNPAKKVTEDFEWLEKYYKKYLEDNLVSDTIIVTAEK